MKKNLFIVIATLWFAAQQVFATSELRNFMTHPKDVPMIRLSEDWEGDGLGWTFVNGTQTNQWIVGTATSNGVGSKSVYISNDGSSNQYTITSTSVVHFYQDVSFPASMESYDLYFDLKTVGEWIGTTTHYDFLEVRIVDTNVTPQAGTRLEEGTQIGMYSNRPTWQTIHETLLSSLSGTTKRLVFTWRNDHQGGAQPPAAVDNIKLEARSYITDAALTEIFFPFRVHETGVKEVKVRLQNHGLPITSGTIRWSVNGATQTPFQWSGNLNYCEQEMVILGSFNFPHGTHTISATVEIMGDANPVNNTVNKTIVFTDPFFYEGWETGGFGWTFVNGTQTNQWMLGVATASVGNRSIYISDDGSSNQYNITSSSVVHFYRDLYFPPSNEDYDFFFDWKGMGERVGAAYYDRLEVHITETSVTPVAGTMLSEATQLGLYNNRSTWAMVHHVLPAWSFSGTTKRLVFSWRNDHAGGTQPPAAVDEIALSARSLLFPPMPPSITTMSLPNGETGDTYHQTLAATGDATIIFTLNEGQLPDGLSLFSDGTIAGILYKSGVFDFKVKAFNTVGNDAKDYKITVTGEDFLVRDTIFQTDTVYIVLHDTIPPIITTHSLPNGATDQPYTYALEATGDTDIFVWALYDGHLPDGLNVYSDGTISGIPSKAGTFELTTIIVNGAGYDIKTFSIRIEQSSSNVVERIQTSPLQAWISEDVLHVKGLTIGQTWRIYSISGLLVYQAVATAEIETWHGAPPNRGTYIIHSENKSVKIVW